MLKRLGALGLAASIALFSAGAAADVAGSPPTGSSGSGGSGGTGGTGGGAGDGGSAAPAKSGCSAADPGTASRSAAIAVGLGLLLAVPALRRRSPKSRKKGSA